MNPRPSPWQGDALPLSHFRSLLLGPPAPALVGGVRAKHLPTISRKPTSRCGQMLRPYMRPCTSQPWWGRRDLNSHGFLHVILSHARMPIPTLPQAARIIYHSEDPRKCRTLLGQVGNLPYLSPALNQLRQTGSPAASVARRLPQAAGPFCVRPARCAGQGQATPSFILASARVLNRRAALPAEEQKVVRDETKPDVVVGVVRVVPVAVHAARVVLIVVPRPAAQNEVSFGLPPRCGHRSPVTPPEWNAASRPAVCPPL